MNIDDPIKNDNRQYDYWHYQNDERQEFSMISELIPRGSKVIDLGCGNRTLLLRLQKERNASVKGIELSVSGVEICSRNNPDVVQGRIDEHLPFEDNSFDYAVCNVTIQMVMYPEILLQEMKWIARYQIVSFPNFAFYHNSLEFILRGAMPTHMLFHYRWYTTGHIHQLSLRDFLCLVQSVGGLTERGIYTITAQNPIKQFFIEKYPNLFMLLPIVLLETTERV